MRPAVLWRQHGGEMIGDIHRPIALLQYLPIDKSQRAVGFAVNIPRMGIAVNKAKRSTAHFCG